VFIKTTLGKKGLREGDKNCFLWENSEEVAGHELWVQNPNEFSVKT